MDITLQSDRHIKQPPAGFEERLVVQISATRWTRSAPRPGSSRIQLFYLFVCLADCLADGDTPTRHASHCRRTPIAGVYDQIVVILPIPCRPLPTKTDMEGAHPGQAKPPAQRKVFLAKVYLKMPRPAARCEQICRRERAGRRADR